jgi:hypothetical protein
LRGVLPNDGAREKGSAVVGCVEPSGPSLRGFEGIVGVEGDFDELCRLAGAGHADRSGRLARDMGIPGLLAIRFIM